MSLVGRVESGLLCSHPASCAGTRHKAAVETGRTGSCYRQHLQCMLQILAQVGQVGIALPDGVLVPLPQLSIAVGVVPHGCLQ